MKAPEAGYRLWLARRIEEGNDLDRCRRQIEVWAANPPEGTVRSLFASMLAELEKVEPKPKPRAKPGRADDVGAFD